MEDRPETGLGDKLPTLWFHCYTISVFSDRCLASFFFNSHNGDSTAALDSLVQCISTLSEKIKSLLLWNSSVSPAKGGPGHGY